MPPEEDIRKTIAQFANSFDLKDWAMLESALAKWVAIRLRWPQLSEELDRDDNLLAALEKHAFAPDGTASPVPGNDWFDNQELLGVLNDPLVPAGKLSTINAAALLRVA